MKTLSTAPTDGETSVSAAAARLAELTNILTAVTGMFGGQIAFRDSKLSVALHEAGAAVILALDGITPATVGIRPITDEDRAQWLGYVDAPSAGGVDSETPARENIKCAKTILAGAVSERLFDPGCRLGSSTDEIGGAQAIIKMAAPKLQRNDKELWSETLTEVEKSLKANEQIVRKIADELIRKETIRSRRLAYLLRAVRRASDEE
jgi:gluconate kinase